MGLTVAKSGDLYRVSDGALTLFKGTLNGAEAWVGARFVRKAPGPARHDIPERWVPWIELLVTDMRAARRNRL